MLFMLLEDVKRCHCHYEKKTIKKARSSREVRHIGRKTKARD